MIFIVHWYYGTRVLDIKRLDGHVLHLRFTQILLIDPFGFCCIQEIKSIHEAQECKKKKKNYIRELAVVLDDLMVRQYYYHECK